MQSMLANPRGEASAAGADSSEENQRLREQLEQRHAIIVGPRRLERPRLAHVRVHVTQGCGLGRNASVWRRRAPRGGGVGRIQ